MASLLRLTALRELNLTDSMELTPSRLTQLATLRSLQSLSLRDCYELKVCSKPCDRDPPPPPSPTAGRTRGNDQIVFVHIPITLTSL